MNEITPMCSRDRCGQIEPISSTTGREVVMLTTSHEFLNSRKGTSPQLMLLACRVGITSGW